MLTFMLHFRLLMHFHEFYTGGKEKKTYLCKSFKKTIKITQYEYLL